MATPHVITYHYQFPDGSISSFPVDVNRPAPVVERDEGFPTWSLLKFNQCPNCPLAGKCTHCPAALDLAPLFERFAAMPSITRVTVTVECPGRLCQTETDAQMGLKALLGLVMASSACPVLRRLRSQALFHLPFASVEETLYRTVGDYLIKQYFLMKDGGTPDFALTGLDALYRDLAELNIHFFKRIEAACAKDANLNALIVLRSMSDIVSMSLDDRLSPLREAMQHE